MSQTTADIHLENVSLKKLVVPKKLLLGVYSVIPIGWLIVLADKLFFKNYLNTTLPANPEQIFLFNVIFVLPHVLASSFNFFDPEYFNYYKEKLYEGAVITLLMVTLIPLIFGYRILMVFYVAWTVLHAVNQQVGLCLMLSQYKSRIYTVFRWMSSILAITLYVDLYTGWSKQLSVHNEFKIISISLLIIYALICALYAQQSKTKIGRIFTWSNYCLLLTSWFFYYLNAPFFVIILPRCVHDFTAFIVYIVHDQNRNTPQANNLIYKPFIKYGIPASLLCPVLACLLALVMRTVNLYIPIQLLIIFAAFVHYYTERFVWKSGSLHRNEVIFI